MDFLLKNEIYFVYKYNYFFITMFIEIIYSRIKIYNRIMNDKFLLIVNVL